MTGSLATFQAASSSMWYYNNASGLLYLKVLHAAETSTLSVGFANSGATPTATPTYTAMQTATSTLRPSSTPTATATNHLFTFVSIADAYVNESSPTTNYGTQNQRSITTTRRQSAVRSVPSARLGRHHGSTLMSQLTLQATVCTIWH
jgi:hypothetical protein